MKVFRRDTSEDRNTDARNLLKIISLGICMFFAAGITTAQATVIYSALPETANGLGLGWSSNAGGQQVVQEFSLANNDTVTTISVYGLSTAGGVNNTPQAFVLEFFADVAGTPNQTSFYSTTTAAIAGVDSGVNWGVWTIYKYTFEVPAQSLSGGTTYWLGAKSTGTSWIWSAAASDGSGDLWSRYGDGAAWYQSSQGSRDNHAFELEGGIIYTCIDPFDSPFDTPLTLKAKKKGAIPVKMQLFDVDGYLVIDSDLSSAPVVNVSYSPSNGAPSEDVTGDLLPVGQANDGNIFHFDSDEDKFIYNLSSKPYKASGDYTVTAVPGDASYAIEGCSQTFIRQ